MKCAKPSYAFALAMHIKDINKKKKKKKHISITLIYINKCHFANKLFIYLLKTQYNINIALST